MSYDKKDFEAVIAYADILYEIEARMGKLKKVGTSHQGCCPFHTEKSPSFTVSENKKVWKCFGCDAAGDVISFVSKYDNISQNEAMRLLAKKYNITVSKETQGETVADETSAMTAIKVASTHFISLLLHNVSAKRYVVSRGIKDAVTLKHWNLGYAPSEYKIEGVDKKSLELAGMYNSKGGWMFRERLIFPIEDITGRVIGFTARDLSGNPNAPKYLNTGDTCIYKKSRALFGLRQAIQTIKAKSIVTITEGPFDVIALHEKHGIRNAVATCGTSLTEEHARMLLPHAKNALLIFDKDAAGVKATVRAAKALYAAGFKVIEVGELSCGKDAAEAESIVGSIPAIEFLFDNIEGDIEQRLLEVIAIIKLCPVPVRRDLLIRELSDVCKMPQDILYEQLNKL